MHLHHFTSFAHLVGILADQEINRGEIPLSPLETVNGVWLTESAAPQKQLWSQGSMVDKTEVCLRTTLKPELGARPWATVAKDLKISPKWQKVLNDVAGGQASSWWVTRKSIALNQLELLVRNAETAPSGYRLVLPEDWPAVKVLALEHFEALERRLEPLRHSNPVVEDWLALMLPKKKLLMGALSETASSPFNG